MHISLLCTSRSCGRASCMVSTVWVHSRVRWSLLLWLAMASRYVHSSSYCLVTESITVQYHFFYLTNVGMNVPVLALVWFAFQDLKSLPRNPADNLPESGENATTSSISRAVLKSRAVWTLSIFLLFYVG